MKFLIAFVFSFAAFSAFSADLSSTVSKIEFDRSARCERTGGSLFNFCSGSMPRMGDASVPYTCIYTAKYRCISYGESATNFTMKIKVKESYSHATLERVSKVLKVSYK
ncbi:MAG TPA: hypothetical protein VNJ08_17675 [Bacteriovoracaceae bacterium]|nr:hypothetical protein [Bacteriovoracaceae bacterium]